MKDQHPKSIPTFVFFAVLQLISISSFALDVWTLPIESELKTLVVANLKSQPKELWISGPNLQDEVHFQIPAFGNLEIPLTDFQNFPWVRAVALETKSLSLEIQTQYDQLIHLEPNQTTNWKVRVKARSELILFNQAPFAQKISIRTPLALWKAISLEAFEKTRIPIGSLSGQVLSLDGEARFSGLLLAAEDSVSYAANPKPQILDPPTGSAAHFFRLSDAVNEQSFIVALTDSKLIQEAQKQIQIPWEIGYRPRILMARVARGSGDVNRDFNSRWKAPWSWHIAEVYSFADFASQSCDGNPEFLEQTLQSWSPDDQGLICFWNYRIVEELTAQQVSSGLKTP